MSSLVSLAMSYPAPDCWLQFAQAANMDLQYPNYSYLFRVPTLKSLKISLLDRSCVYFCGNSLGLMPVQTKQYLDDELEAWGSQAVEAHFDHPKTNWMDIDLPLVPVLAGLVGALELEVGVMNTLTSNLNSLLTVFYKPQGSRTKILLEKGAFPSDYYAFLNQVRLNRHHIQGFGSAEDHLLQLEPRQGAYAIRTEDILETIEKHKHELALICLPGIQYYSGQLFDIEKITAFGKKHGIVVGWDLAHAVGNVKLELHQWGVDFACWCSYKYLNSGPGGIGGYFINCEYSTDAEIPRLAGWWGNNESERFQMKEEFNPILSALGFRQSNPSVLDVVALKSSLDVFVGIKGDIVSSMDWLTEKSKKLTGLLYSLLTGSKHHGSKYVVITPADPAQRGAQLSLLFFGGIMEDVFRGLRENGIIGDERRPDVIRLAPIPLYNSFEEVEQVVQVLEGILDTL